MAMNEEWVRTEYKGSPAIEPKSREGLGYAIPLVNPLEVGFFDGTYRSYHREGGLYVLWFGAYADTRLAVWQGSLDDALEEAAAWLAEFAPGHIVSDEEIAELVREAQEEDPELDEGEAYEQATADLTYTESGYITSYEWGISYEPSQPNDDMTEALISFAADLYEEEYDERPEGL